MTLKQLLEQCSWEQIEAVIPQYRMLDLRSEEDIIEIKYIKSLYERMRQLQPQKSRQKIRLFLEPDIDNWIEAEIACEQDGKLVFRLFDDSVQESLGMEVYPDGVVLTPAEQAFYCLYAVIKHEEAVWYLDYLHRTHMG